MTNYADPNAFLMGGGAKSAKFDNEGDKVVGTILDMQVKQQTDIKTGAPRTWDNGDPMMQLVVTLQTDARDDEDDDGQRTLYVKGQMQRAVQDQPANFPRRRVTGGASVSPRRFGRNDYIAKKIPELPFALGPTGFFPGALFRRPGK